MAKYKYKEAFNFFLEGIKKANINWALTGSYRLYLESNQYFNASDIDILTDKKGAELISSIFNNWIIKEFIYSETNGIYSFFGQLKINNVVFDVMSDVQNRIDGKWYEIPNLNYIDYLKIDKFEIPVLPLLVEYELSNRLGQNVKNLQIEKILKEKKQQHFI